MKPDLKLFANDPAAFRESLLIDVDGTPKRFSDVQEPWQREDFAAIDSGLKCAAGRSSEPAKLRCLLERPRGHSKTTDIALAAIWALAFATRPLRGFCYAADRDQAQILKQAVMTIVRLNPWLADVISVEANRIVTISGPAEGATLTIEASDVASSYGILPDFIIADELCHWPENAGEQLWHSLISSAAKRSNCFLFVITNAGFQDSWQWSVREAARTDPNWHFSRLDGPVASWITPDRLAEQQRHLPEIAYRRLWLNQWSSGGGDALRPEDIDAAFDPNFEPMTGREAGWRFVAGVDIGITRDCSAVVVLAVPDNGHRLRLAHHRLWRPTLGKRIDILEVERHILDLDRQFNLTHCAFDPYQMEAVAARLEKLSQRRSRQSIGTSWMREIPPTGKNLQQIATLTIEGFQDKRFQLFPSQPILNDLRKLRVEERQWGHRLTSPRDGDGHGDSFSAFGVALLIAHELATTPRFTVHPLFGNVSTMTPMERLAERWEQRQREHAEHEAWIAKQREDDGWSAFARRIRMARGL